MKAYEIDETNQLENLADFLDYSWNKEEIVEHFISVFHTLVDKISDLNIDDKLKGHQSYDKPISCNRIDTSSMGRRVAATTLIGSTHRCETCTKMVPRGSDAI